MHLKDMSQDQQWLHARIFDSTLSMLTELHKGQGPDNASLAAVAAIHAGVHFLVHNNKKLGDRRHIYNWLQKICDDLVI